MDHMRPARLLSLPLLIAGLLAGCRTTQPKGAGALVVTPLYNPAATPSYLGLDGTHFFAQGTDANAVFDLEVQQDGCVRGIINPSTIEVCPVPGQDPNSDVKTYRLKGPLGERTFTVETRGDHVYVDFGIGIGRAQFVVPDGLLRQHPEMVAAAWFHGAFGRPPTPGAELQAYLIRPRGS
jgi:hypothetical protein